VGDRTELRTPADRGAEEKERDDMKLNDKVGCQYDWPPETRAKLHISSAYARLTMSEFSAICIDAGFEAVESLRRTRSGPIQIEELIREIKHVLTEQPEKLRIVQETLLSFSDI
jgi:hypothetical protein